MPRMGGIRLAASLASAGLVLCACGGSAQAAVHEDTLVLEVGGASSSLREALDVRDQQTIQMWARVGYAPPVGPAPRRGVDAHVIKA